MSRLFFWICLGLASVKVIFGFYLNWPTLLDDSTEGKWPVLLTQIVLWLLTWIVVWLIVLVRKNHPIFLFLAGLIASFAVLSEIAVMCSIMWVEEVRLFDYLMVGAFTFPGIILSILLIRSSVKARLAPSRSVTGDR